MKKTISVLLAVLMTAGIFTSCKNSENKQDISQSSATSSAETERSETSIASITETPSETVLTTNTTKPAPAEQVTKEADITKLPVETTVTASSETAKIITAETLTSNDEYITIQGVKYSTRLTELDLHNKKLTNEDIIDIKKMKNLTRLNLSWNKISDISPLSELKNLLYLVLSGNEISNKDIELLRESLPNTIIYNKT